MSVLILIPARGGSKGVPGKNLREVGGISLVGRAIMNARAFESGSEAPECVIHVDSDSQAIADEAAKWGVQVPFLRPPDLAQDTTSTVDSVLHSIAQFEQRGLRFQTIVLLQPTSPLRAPFDIAEAWKLHNSSGGTLTVSLAENAHPVQLSVTLKGAGEMEWAFGSPGTTIRRQDFVPTWRPNGAVYVADVKFLLRERTFFAPEHARGFPMPVDRSIDVDTETDLALANALAARLPFAPAQAGQRLSGLAPAVLADLSGGVPESIESLINSLRLRGFHAFASNDANGGFARTVISRHSHLTLARIVDLDRDRGDALQVKAGAGNRAATLLLTDSGPDCGPKLFLGGIAARNGSVSASGAGILRAAPEGAGTPDAARAVALARSLDMPVGLKISGRKLSALAAIFSDVSLLVLDAEVLLELIEQNELDV